MAINSTQLMTARLLINSGTLLDVFYEHTNRRRSVWHESWCCKSATVSCCRLSSAVFMRRSSQQDCSLTVHQQQNATLMLTSS